MTQTTTRDAANAMDGFDELFDPVRENDEGNFFLPDEDLYLLKVIRLEPGGVNSFGKRTVCWYYHLANAQTKEIVADQFTEDGKPIPWEFREKTSVAMSPRSHAYKHVTALRGTPPQVGEPVSDIVDSIIGKVALGYIKHVSRQIEDPEHPGQFKERVYANLDDHKLMPRKNSGQQALPKEEAKPKPQPKPVAAAEADDDEAF